MNDDTASPPPLETEEPMSPGARLFNVVATPGDVFAEVADEEHCLWNWLVPMLLTAALGILSVNLIFSNPATLAQIQEQQVRGIQQQVEAGKITAEQAKDVEKQMEKLGPDIMRVFGSIGAAVGSVAWLFLQTLVLWLLARSAWKSEVGYTKVLEVAGLASVVTLLGGIITMLLILATGKLMANPGPALLLSQIDPQNKLHLMLVSLNAITLWYVSVLSLGLAKVCGRSFANTAAWLYGSWLVLRGGLILTGWAGNGM